MSSCSMVLGVDPLASPGGTCGIQARDRPVGTLKFLASLLIRTYDCRCNEDCT